MADPLSRVAARAWERLESLGQITDTPPGLTRSFLSPASISAARQIMDWMEECGLRTSHDVMGNIRGCSAGPDTRPLLLGSHIDTVIDAGKYDGALGIIVAIAAVELLAAQGSPLSRPIEILGFSDEEGVRFQAAYLGSRACIGELNDEALAVKDESGRTVREIIVDEGWHEGAEEIRLHESDGTGYVEIHIEQGRVLEESGNALGVVPAICGQTRSLITLRGRAEHAGTTPMPMRQDALAGAAACVLAIENIAKSQPPLVATVGKLEVSPGASNAIPGRVTFTLDVRHPDDTRRETAVGAIESAIGEIALARSLEYVHEIVQSTPAVVCDPLIVSLLAKAIGGSGSVPHIPSGAGHDAVMMSRIMPVGMLFVRCREGRSHHPDEAITEDDLAAAIAATARFINLMEPQEGPHA